MLAAVAAALGTREWHGLPWLLPVLLPLLALRRATRPLGLVAGGQALVYLSIYLTSGLEARFYVLSSLPRLLFHLMPAALVGLALLLFADPGYSTSTSGRPSVSA